MRIVLPFKPLYTAWEDTYGSVGKDPLIVAMALQIYIVGVYSVEKNKIKEKFKNIPFDKEVIALELARSDALKSTFEIYQMPKEIHSLQDITFDGDLIIIHTS